MTNFLQRLWVKSTPVAYRDEWLLLRSKHGAGVAPNPELATTKQSLIVCCAIVLDRLWNGNGGAGWEEGCESDYIAPLEEHLVSRAVFSEDQCEAIRDALAKIVAVGRQNIAITEKAEEDSTLLPAGKHVDFIVCRVVDWCRHYPTPVPLGNEPDYVGHD